MKDQKICPCCGQARPYPTEPGIWEYLEYPALISDNPRWIRAMVRRADEHDYLEMVKEGETEPSWWPEQAQWRKVID